MKKKLRYFNREFISGSYGMTLTEVLISVGITSVVLVFAFNLITDFTRRSWEHETKSKAMDELELAANIIISSLPQFITSVTGPMGEDVPPATFWSCTSSDCVMSVVYSYKDLNGVSASTTLNPLRADCVSVTDARLATSGVGLNTKANGSLGAAKCLHCPVGKAPRISVNMYSFDATSGAPTVRTPAMFFPKDIGQTSKQGSLAMGICVDWPAYLYNDGTATATLNVNRYDRWSVTLIPVFAKDAQRGGMTDAQIAASLNSLERKILVSPTNRFAPDFGFMPSR